MKRRGIRYVIPIIFIAVLVGAMVTYVLLHKNTEAEKGLDYASLIGVTGDSDFRITGIQMDGMIWLQLKMDIIT